MASQIERRKFLATLGGAAVAWPLGARAQQAAMPVIGYLDVASPEPYAFFLAALRKGLTEIGYVEGQNVAFELRWAEGRAETAKAIGLEVPPSLLAIADEVIE